MFHQCPRNIGGGGRFVAPPSQACEGDTGHPALSSVRCAADRMWDGPSPGHLGDGVRDVSGGDLCRIRGPTGSGGVLEGWPGAGSWRHPHPVPGVCLCDLSWQKSAIPPATEVPRPRKPVWPARLARSANRTSPFGAPETEFPVTQVRRAGDSPSLPFSGGEAPSGLRGWEGAAGGVPASRTPSGVGPEGG